MRSPGPVPTIDEMRAEFELVLAHLQGSTSVGKFLAFICEEYFAGRADRLKEYTIAVEAFGRAETFQAKEDPIVRVHAMRLRQRLAEYYRGEGSHHKVQLRLPKGGYVPAFEVLVAEPETKPAEPNPKSAKAQAVPAETDFLLAKSFWQRSPYRIGGAALFLVALLLMGWLVLSGQGQTSSSASVQPSTPSVIGQQDELRILSGNAASSYVDKLGRVWVGDRYYAGGDSSQPMFAPIARVYDSKLWKMRRIGQSFKYDIPLKPGTYELHLHFFEDAFGIDEEHGGGEGSRVFDVDANGKPLLTRFDIVRDAGGARIGDERVFLVSPHTDGFLHLNFRGRVDRAMLSGIELIPTEMNRMRPIRIATRTTHFVSSKQVIWRPDQYYSGGRQHEVKNPVSNTADAELFATERFGNFNYAIPVADGTYTAVLYFSETLYGAGTVSEGVGGRVFDVSFNGAKILKDFDIYKEAGGANRVVRKEFHGLRPNALGKLVFTFQPNRNNPSINAIEIIPEG